jgi:hypothetical protein
MAESKVFKYFGLKKVNIIMRDLEGSQELRDGSTVTGSIVVSGYLLDEDDELLYFGSTMESIDDSLKRSDIIRIFSTPAEGDEFIEAPEDMDTEGGMQ